MRYTRTVRLPDRKALAERNAEDDRLALEQARRCTVGERLAQALELSDVARALAVSVGASWVVSPADDLADKARRYPPRRPG